MRKTESPTEYEKLLKAARMPKGNPLTLDGFDFYDLTPVDHDYPGQFAKKANHVFRKLGLSIGFVMMVGDPANAAQIYETFRRDPRYLGGGTGSGFKNRAPAVLDELDPLAAQIGAVNVVAKINGRLRGYNTDGMGFTLGLEDFLLKQKRVASVKGLRVLIIGAGGTADAIAFTLASKGAMLTILNRTAEKAENLAKRICIVYGDVAFGGSENLLTEKLPQADVIVNASTKSAEGPFKDFVAFAPAKEGALEENLRQGTQLIHRLNSKPIVCDINLCLDESQTLCMAREAGHLIQDGAAMNFHQAVESLWIIHEKIFTQKGVSKEEVSRLIKEVS